MGRGRGSKDNWISDLKTSDKSLHFKNRTYVVFQLFITLFCVYLPHYETAVAIPRIYPFFSQCHKLGTLTTYIEITNTYILSSSDSLPDRVWSKRAAASDNWTLPSSSNTPRTSPCMYGVSKAWENRQTFLKDRFPRQYAVKTVVWSVSFNMLTLATYFSVVQASLRRGKWPAVVGTNRRLRSPPQKKHCHLFCMHTVQ